MRTPLWEREENWKSVHYLSSFKTTLSLWEREIIIDTAREWQMKLLALCARFHSFVPGSDSPRDVRLLNKNERDAGAGMRAYSSQIQLFTNLLLENLAQLHPTYVR